MEAKTKFLIRSTFLPKTYSEYPLFLFVCFILPLTYWFQFWVVFPSLFPPPSITYYTLFALGLFGMHNVVGNFVGVILCDTSIRGRIMPDESQLGVKYCTVCETVTPPRSFHCPSCGVCILKRDHHCIFTSCCVGHYNHRYFIFFMIYVSLSILFCLPFNVYYLWDMLTIYGFSLVTSLLFPIILFLMDMGPQNIDEKHIYVALFMIQMTGLIFVTAWLLLHLKLILRGTLLYELRHQITSYSLSTEKNIKMVFGENWYLSWISPLIPSQLLCDGINFPVNNRDNNDICKKNSEDTCSKVES